MGKQVGPPIDEETRTWVAKQHVFFVASAPLSAKNRVNVSPKSASEFAVIGDNVIGYMDKTGSGCETAAHIMENGRLTIMFVALKGAPKIVRFYGEGKVLTPDAFLHDRKLMDAFGIASEEEWTSKVIGGRSIILMEVKRVTSSCGYSIPIYEYQKERKTLDEYALKADLPAYRRKKNSFSIDGLKSIAQVLVNETPSSCTLEDGYLFAEYQESSNILTKWFIQLRMAYASGLRDTHKHFLSFLLGILLCKLFLKSKK